jgi:tripartite-type tricarboxylate transporter receptor subunit TctC
MTVLTNAFARMFARRQLALAVFASAGLVAGAVFAPGASLAQTKYPEKPAKIVVPFGAGGVGDITMRLLAQRMQEITGQPVVIDNRPGAGGRLAMRAVLDAPADGYTMGVTGNGQAISQSLFERRPYDIVNDFSQVSVIASFDILLTVPQKSPYKTMRDVVEAARKNPGKLSFGTILPGSTQNLSAYLLVQQENLKAEIITYKTTPDLITALMRGEIDVGFDFYAGFVSALEDKQLRVLATGGEERTEYLPDVPTAKESGYPNYIVTSWNGLSTAAGIPADVLKRLNGIIVEALRDPGLRKKALALGLKAEGTTPEGMRERMIADVKRWGDVIEKAGIPKQ